MLAWCNRGSGSCKHRQRDVRIPVAEVLVAAAVPADDVFVHALRGCIRRTPLGGVKNVERERPTDTVVGA